MTNIQKAMIAYTLLGVIMVGCLYFAYWASGLKGSFACLLRHRRFWVESLNHEHLRCSKCGIRWF